MSEKFARTWGKRGSNDLIGFMDKVSDDLSINFEVANEDAQKILKEAHTRIKNKRKPS